MTCPDNSKLPALAGDVTFAVHAVCVLLFGYARMRRPPRWFSVRVPCFPGMGVSSVPCPGSSLFAMMNDGLLLRV